MKKKSKKKGSANKLGKSLALLVAIVAGVFYLMDDINTANIELRDIEDKIEQKIEQKIGQKLEQNVEQVPVTGNVEIPRLKKSVPSQILEYKGFTVSYNSENRLPNWVAYELTAVEAQGDNPRKDKFRQDPNVIGPQANKEDYRNSGWDRGHMAPAADFKWSAEAMDESYYFTNICPQNTQLNTGDWKELEEQCRKWSLKYGSIYIVCGPIILSNEHGKLGANEVVIPDKFYKVLLTKINGEYRGSAFVFHNPPKRKSKISGKAPVSRPLESYAVTIDEVEQITGIDFFPTLPSATQNRVEQQKGLFR